MAKKAPSRKRNNGTSTSVGHYGGNDAAVVDQLIAKDRQIQKEEDDLAKLEAKAREKRKAIATHRDELRGLIRLNDPEQAPLYNQEGRKVQPDGEQQGELHDGQEGDGDGDGDS